MKKERIILYGSLIAGILLLLAVWNSWFSVTKIGFVNYQAINFRLRQLSGHQLGGNLESQQQPIHPAG